MPYDFKRKFIIAFYSIRYNEEKYYDYNTGSPTGYLNGHAVGHFTQIVWKRSTKLGIAKANGKKVNGNFCTYVVARYTPPGNYASKQAYINNVEKP